MTAASDQSNCKEVFGTALYTSVHPNSSIPSPNSWGIYIFFPCNQWWPVDHTSLHTCRTWVFFKWRQTGNHTITENIYGRIWNKRITKHITKYNWKLNKDVSNTPINSVTTSKLGNTWFKLLILWGNYIIQIWSRVPHATVKVYKT